MTERQFNEACKWANLQLKDWQVEQALECINNRQPLPYDVKDILTEAMCEWCEDNDLPFEAWEQWGDIEDVFFNFDID